MKEKVIYIAEDGKQFNNKEDCVKYENNSKAITTALQYISFYANNKKIELELSLLEQNAFIQRYINNNKDSEFSHLIDYFLELVYFIHVDKDIPNSADEVLVEKILEQLCNDLPEITHFDFKKGITYFYDEDLECFTNTEYETEKINKQLKFLTEIENLD